MIQSDRNPATPPEVVVRPERPKAYVALYHMLDAAQWKRQYDAGLTFDESPYGFHHAREHGFDVVFSTDAPRPEHGDVAPYIIRLLGFDLLHAWTNRKRVAEADIVWTLTEGEGFAIAFLMALRLVPRRPIICNVVWMLNLWSVSRTYKRAINRLLGRYLSVMSVHAQPCLDLARRAFPDVRSELMHFGVDADLLRRAPLRTRPPGAPLQVVSMGSDKTRDWPTLLAAFGNDPRFHLTVVCWRLTEADVAPYNNVTLFRVKSRADFLSCYHGADLAVVPMVENIFSGITAALDAAAIGVPVLCSRTGGVPTYFTEDEVIYVPTGSPEAMREAAAAPTDAERSAQADRAHRRFQTSNYSTRHLAEQYCVLSRGILIVSQA